MTNAEALASLLVMLPAIWAAVHLGLSRFAELRSDRLERQGAPESDVTMLRKRARTLQDMSRLMPNWMLLILLFALAWRVILLILDLAC
ncbi:hypothetical protein ACQQ2Q_12235 [Agrobacterium sp. ES01]|uniref:hypothetical protein n=1 Tax=Agrobacterium sp. ES01 TaxID=3420714 RepID=UPI003D0E669C